MAGKPCSSMVGTSGSAGTRSLVVTPSALRRPPFTCWMRRGDGGEHQLDVAAHDVGDCRARAALVGHVVHVEAGVEAEHLHLQAVEAAAARRGEVDLALVRLGVLDQLLGIVGRELGVGDQYAGRVGDDRDRDEILLGLDGEVGEQTRVDRDGADIAEENACSRRARARAATSMPTLPAAPARFSTTTCWPRNCVSPGWISLATKSEAPPGANGTITRMGWVGYLEASCAAAVPMATTEARIAATTAKALRKLVVIVLISL